MINSVEQYLAELRKELAGSDRATVQDALSDAEEYLRTALVNAGSAATEPETLDGIIAKYGQPAEVASAYREVRDHIRRTKTSVDNVPVESPTELKPAIDNRPFYVRFFTVYKESAAWSAFLYMIFSLITGIAYFTWAVTGVSLSLGLLVLIIGIPFAGLFLLSVRGIALMEGRIVEALLGVRMPRRPLFSRSDIGWWQKMKSMLASPHTWTALAYMIFQLPLGVIYFSVFISLIAVSLWAIAMPFLQIVINIPLFTSYGDTYYLAGWFMPFFIIAGVLLLTATLHLAKIIGRLHGRLAKSMLVRE